MGKFKNDLMSMINPQQTGLSQKVFVGINRDQKKVSIQFTSAVSGMLLTCTEARDFAEVLLQYADALSNPQAN